MQMIDVLKRLAELDSANPNVIREGQSSPELQQLLAMQQKYRGTPYEQQLNKRVASQQWRDANGKGAPVDAAGRPVPVLSPEEFEKKNPDFLKKGTAPATGGNKNWLVTPDEAKASQDAEAAAQSTLRESLDLAECGMMPMPGMGGQSHTPASISMTANSGPELSGMLADIMKLAGVHQVEPAHLGIQPAHDHGHNDVEVISSEPVELDGGDETEIMRSMMDRMNGEMDGDEEETDEGMYDNSPNSPEPEQSFDANQYAHQENQPGGGDRMDGNMPKAYPTMEEKLMADWKQFMTEDRDQDIAEGLFGIDDSIKAKIQTIVSRISDEPGNWDHKNQEFTPQGMEELKDALKNNRKFIRYALQLNSSDHEAGHYHFSKDEFGEQNIAEGGEEHTVKSVGSKINPATNERCDFYVNPITNKEVFCKPGQKVNKGDHVNPKTGKVTPKV